MSSQYDRGRRFEWATRDHLAEHGYEVVRSAGSKTKIDLVAFKPGELLLIQCKLPDSNVSGAEWNKLLGLALMVGDAKAILAEKVTGCTTPEYRRLRLALLPRERRILGTHYEPWSPDPLGA